MNGYRHRASRADDAASEMADTPLHCAARSHAESRARQKMVSLRDDTFLPPPAGHELAMFHRTRRRATSCLLAAARVYAALDTPSLVK